MGAEGRTRGIYGYVGVIRFVFHVLQLDLHKKILCCTSKSMIKFQQKSDWKSDLP
jgi:hypothetical protein